MADTKANTDQLQHELEQLRKENAALKKGRKPNDHTGTIVPGSVKLELEQPDGKKKKVEMKYVQGFVNSRLPKGTQNPGAIVSSLALMKLANGKSLTEEELKLNPSLANIDQEKAISIFAKWAQMQVSFLEPA